MKPTEMPIVALAIICSLGFCATPSTSVPIVPGWEEDPGKYNVYAYALCDYYCAEALEDPQSFITDLMDKVNKIMGQLNVYIVVVGLEIWNKHGWTNWTSRPNPQEINVQYDWLGRQIDHYLNKTFFDELLLFTGMPVKYNGQDARGMNKVACISNSRCWGIISVSRTGSPQELLPSNTAHELAHGFDIAHDTDGCGCHNGNGKCVMNSATIMNNAARPTFSDCSKEQFGVWVNSPNGVTLRKPTASSDEQVRGARCGNGFVDEGEECDCGPGDLPIGCSKCCDNCKMAQDAQCAAGKCCNTPKCKFHDNKKLCRKSRDDSCDADDFCSGTSSECKNSYKPDWAECTDFAKETGYCKGGFCNTINTQCRFVWDKDYKAASDSCYNSSNNAVEKDENSTAILHPKCQTLICGGDGKNDGLHDGRNPQRTVLGKDECLTGRYLEMERTYLGLSGKMTIEDGTKCAADSACFAGECLPKSTVIEKMKAQSIFQRKTARCGNGKVDPGEDCDCGPKQCECCNFLTCKVRPKDVPCLGIGCGLCDGNSTECKGLKGKASDFKFCSAENTDEVCFNGRCKTLTSTCSAHFWTSDAVKSAQRQNVGQSSLKYNAGGFFLVESSTNIRVYEEYSAGEDDGVCGVVHCKKSQFPPQYFVNDGDENLTSRMSRGGPEYRVQHFSADSESQVLYYQPGSDFEVTLPNGQRRKVSMFVPVMADEGQACKLSDDKPGYCRRVDVQSKNISSITYSKLKCSEMPTPSSHKDLYQFS